MLMVVVLQLEALILCISMININTGTIGGGIDIALFMQCILSFFLNSLLLL